MRCPSTATDLKHTSTYTPRKERKGAEISPTKTGPRLLVKRWDNVISKKKRRETKYYL